MSADRLTPGLLRDVLTELEPVIAALLAQPGVARPGIAVSVALDLGRESVELGDHVFGDLSANPYPNEEIARQKRDLSLRSRMAGSTVPAHLVRAGDSEWVGSAWVEGIAVGCAGLTETQDEMVAHWIAYAIRQRAAAIRHETV